MMNFRPPHENDCIHETFLQNTCIQCGGQLQYMPQAIQDRVATLVARGGAAMKVSLEKSEKNRYDNTLSLFQRKKLALFIDLDQTLIHSTPFPCFYQLSTTSLDKVIGDAGNPFITQNHYELKQDLYTLQLTPSEFHLMKLRPGARAFLEALAPYYDLHIFTMGSRIYAEAIVGILDPTRRLIKKIVARGENGKQYKDLDSLLPINPDFVLLLDDLQHVWKQTKNVVHLQPFVFWKEFRQGSSTETMQQQFDAAYRTAIARSTPHDNILFTVYRLLLTVWTTFYSVPLCSIPIIDLQGFDQLVTNIIAYLGYKYDPKIIDIDKLSLWDVLRAKQQQQTPELNKKKNNAPELLLLKLYVNNPLYKVLLYRNNNKTIERSLEHFLLQKKLKENEQKPATLQLKLQSKFADLFNNEQAILNTQCPGCPAMNCQLLPSLIKNTITFNPDKLSIYVSITTHDIISKLRSLIFSQFSFDYDKDLYTISRSPKTFNPTTFDCLTSVFFLWEKWSKHSYTPVDTSHRSHLIANQAPLPTPIVVNPFQPSSQTATSIHTPDAQSSDPSAIPQPQPQQDLTKNLIYSQKTPFVSMNSTSPLHIQGANEMTGMTGGDFEMNKLTPYVKLPFSSFLHQNLNHSASNSDSHNASLNGRALYHLSPPHHHKAREDTIDNPPSDLHPDPSAHPLSNSPQITEPIHLSPLFCVHDLQCSQLYEEYKKTLHSNSIPTNLQPTTISPPPPSTNKSPDQPTTLTDHGDAREQVPVQLEHDDSNLVSLQLDPRSKKIHRAGGHVVPHPVFPSNFLETFALPDPTNTTPPVVFSKSTMASWDSVEDHSVQDSTSSLRMLHPNYLSTLQFPFDDFVYLARQSNREFPTHYLIMQYRVDDKLQDARWKQIELYNRFVFELWVNKAFIHREACPFFNSANNVKTYEECLDNIKLPVTLSGTQTDQSTTTTTTTTTMHPTSEQPQHSPPTPCLCTQFSRCGFRDGDDTFLLHLFDQNALRYLPPPIHIIHINYVDDSHAHWTRLPDGPYLSSLSSAFAIDPLTKFSHATWLKNQSLYVMLSNFNGTEATPPLLQQQQQQKEEEGSEQSLSTTTPRQLTFSSALNSLTLKTPHLPPVINSKNPPNMSPWDLHYFNLNSSPYDFTCFFRSGSDLYHQFVYRKQSWTPAGELKKQSAITRDADSATSLSFDPLTNAQSAQPTTHPAAHPQSTSNQYLGTLLPYMHPTPTFTIKPNGTNDFLSVVNHLEAIPSHYYSIFGPHKNGLWHPDRLAHELRKQYLPLHAQPTVFGFLRMLQWCYLYEGVDDDDDDDDDDLSDDSVDLDAMSLSEISDMDTSSDGEDSRINLDKRTLGRNEEANEIQSTHDDTNGGGSTPTSQIKRFKMIGTP